MGNFVSFSQISVIESWQSFNPPPPPPKKKKNQLGNPTHTNCTIDVKQFCTNRERGGHDRRLKRVRPFVSLHTAIKIYKGLIEPHFDYKMPRENYCFQSHELTT